MGQNLKVYNERPVKTEFQSKTILFSFIGIFILAATITVLAFMQKPIYNNFRMLSTTLKIMIGLEATLFVAIGFYIYNLYKINVKNKLFHSILIGSTLLIFFFNVIGFVLLPILVVGYMSLKNRGKWWVKLITGTSLLFIAPIYTFATIFTVAAATILKDSDTTSYKIQSKSLLPEVQTGTNLNVATWNIGYAGTGSEMSYFYDEGENGPGKHGKNWSEDQDKAHMAGIKQFITSATKGIDLPYYESTTIKSTRFSPSTWEFSKNPLDFLFLQEVDKPSVRSFYHDQTKEVASMVPGFDVNFVNNLKVGALPVPLFDPIQQVDAGVLTAAKYKMNNDDKRIWLGTKGKGLAQFFNLKRAINYTTYNVKGSTKKLIMANVHMSAFPQDEQKRRIEFDKIKELIASWGDNYVVIGGDWNTDINNIFRGSESFVNAKDDVIWGVNGFFGDQGQLPGTTPIDVPRPIAKVSQDFHLWMKDASKNTHGYRFISDSTFNHSSNRFVDQVWHGSDGVGETQAPGHTFDSTGSIIDGFLVSSNIAVAKGDITTLQQGWHKNPFNPQHPYLFADSDHNPSIMKFQLIP